MNIDSIKNGFVLDHIKAGKSMKIYNYLELDKLDCVVAVIKNVPSRKMGKKDSCGGRQRQVEHLYTHRSGESARGGDGRGYAGGGGATSRQR
mgnify:CR=1 FL=1